MEQIGKFLDEPANFPYWYYVVTIFLVYWTGLFLGGWKERRRQRRKDKI